MKTNYLCGLFLLCVLVWGRSEAHAEKPLKTLDLYLCIGQSNMAGRGKFTGSDGYSTKCIPAECR